MESNDEVEKRDEPTQETVAFEEGVTGANLKAGDQIRVQIGDEWKTVTVLGTETTEEPVTSEGPADKPVLSDSSIANVDGNEGVPTVPGQSELQDEENKDYLLELYKAGKPLTEKQMRTLRGRYFTVKHIPQNCGHKLDMINEPRNNCQQCWFQWFNTHGQLCQTMDQAYHEKGLDFLISMRGKKAVKMFLKFMSTLAAWQNQMAQMQAQQQQPPQEGQQNG